MKKVISVVLSLAMLVSLFIMPMTVSAQDPDPVADLKAAVAGLQDLIVEYDASNHKQVLVPAGSYGRGQSGLQKIYAPLVEEGDMVPELGTQAVTIPTGYATTSGIWTSGDDPDYYLVSSVGGELSSTVKSDVLPKDVGKFVFYVKTNVDIILSPGIHSGESISVAPQITLEASADYQRVSIDIGLFDKFASNYPTLPTKLSNFLLCIDKVEEGEILESDEIIVGSVFVVDADPVKTKFAADYAEATTLSAQMIADAEAIDITQYKAETVPALQSAIAAAKEAYLATAEFADIIALVKAEASNMTKIVEVFTPKFINTPNPDTEVGGNIQLPSVKPEISVEGDITQDVIDSLGSHYAKNTKENTIIFYTDPAAEMHKEADPIVDFRNYKDMYMTVIYDGEDTFKTGMFNFLIAELADSSIRLSVNDWDAGVYLEPGVNKIDLYSLIVNHDASTIENIQYKWRENNIVYFLENNTNYLYEGAARMQITGLGNMGAEDSIIFGTIFGEEYFDASVFDLLTERSEIVPVYNALVKDQGYINAEGLTDTVAILGNPPVVEGAEEGTYCSDVTLTITDEDGDLTSVTVDTIEKFSELNENQITVSGNGDHTVVATDAKGNAVAVEFTIGHSIVIYSDGAAICAECENCDDDEQKDRIEIVAPENLVYAKDTSYNATLIEAAPEILEDVEESDIVYYFNDGADPVTETNKPGTYKAVITANDEEAFVIYTVECEHDGGKATHDSKAVCDICGEEYGEALPHGTATWVKDSIGWRMLYEDGCAITNTWAEDSIGWCYLGEDGYMLTNKWVKDSKGWCYVGGDGYCVTNTWMEDSIGWCYLNADGRMATNQWIKDSQGWCYVGSDGYCVTNKWVKDSKGWCYLDANGRMVYNQWVKDYKGWCYVGSNGYMVTNTWVKDSQGPCYIGSDGYFSHR